MLTLVEARNSQGALLSLPLDDVSGGYSVVDIAGLDPVKATIVSSSFAGQDGAQFQNARREERNIVLQLGLEADYVSVSVRELRTKLYNFFMPKSRVSLRFHDSTGLVVDISGWVESCEAPLFVKEPQTNISILCLDSDFTELTSNALGGMTSDDASDDEGELLVSYDGSVETGIELALSVNRALTEFTIYHRTPDGSMNTTDIAGSFAAGDLIVLNTVVGSKGLTLIRSGSPSSLLYAKSPQSGWIELTRGDNHILVYAVGGAMPYTVKYTTLHGGL